MDTKLKRYNGAARCGYGLLWVLLLVSTVAAGINISILASMFQIQRYNLDEDFLYGYYDENGTWISYGSVWTGEVSLDAAEFRHLLTEGGMAAVICTVSALILLILILVFTGRFDREIMEENNGTAAETRIHLNWYDRIWSEVHVMSMMGFGTGFCFLALLLYELWAAQDWFGLFLSDYADGQYYGIPNELAGTLILLAMTGAAVFCLTSLVSLVKKLKAGMFWEKSLIGGVLLFVWRGVRGSDRTTWKVVCYLLLLCAIAGFCGMRVYWTGWHNEGWIFAGAVVCILLILAVVPGKIRKFKAIRTAASEIRGGNLACKVPVQPGKSGRMDELDRLAMDLNHIGEAQQEAIASELKNQRMKTELISNVSHDLKTPLTSMTAYIDLLKKEGLDSPNAEEYLQIIDQKTRRLKTLTENLFEAAKASSGAIPVTIEEIDLPALITQSLAEMEEKLSARGLTVIVRNLCEKDPDGCRVMADGQLLWRMIENVLGNVSKYALSGSRVYVNMEKLISQRPDQPNRIVLDVKNISADPLNISEDELMERFKRGDESRNTEGSGLGLAIARDLAGLMNGVFEISIDGDLFKSSIILDEAVSAGQIKAAAQARQSSSERKYSASAAGQAAGQAVTQAAEQAGQAVGNAVRATSGVFSTMKEKLQEKSRVKKTDAEQPDVPDTPIPEFEPLEK